MKLIKIILTILFVFIAACQTVSLEGQKYRGKTSTDLITLDTRPKVEQKFILIKPPAPTASVILFAGGGILKLSSSFGIPTINRGKNIFLVRTRDIFAKHGFMVALVDAPYDREFKVHMSIDRTGEESLTDIRSVVSFLKQKADVPVWVVGTCLGSDSAAHIAIHNNGQVDGVVLTSSMTTIMNQALKKVKIPTLIVAHKEDKCVVTPPEGAEWIRNELINSPKVEIKYFTGGKTAIENECWGLSAHGFYGIEEQVVFAIADFIKSN